MLLGIKRETLYMFILLLVLLPQPKMALNCQMACDHCYDDAEDPPLQEVYCSMCEECLAAKRMNERKRTKMRTLKTEEPATIEEPPKLLKPKKRQKKQLLRAQEYGWDPEEQMQGMYPECPTAPPCPEEEEEPMNEEISKEEVVSEPNCPNPYMPPCLPMCPQPRPTCPPIVTCKPKKMKTTKKPLKPKTKRPPPPMPQPWCCPFPCPPQATPGQDQENFKDTTNKDFVYVYVGVPKGVIAKS